MLHNFLVVGLTGQIRLRLHRGIGSLSDYQRTRTYALWL